jgi:hypothetical protein
MRTSRFSRYISAVEKGLRLIQSGRPDLLVSIPLYRIWWRSRGLDFGVVSIRELGLDSERANYHKDGGGPLLYDLLKQLNIAPTDSALDIGSGKAGAIATMARFPFRRVDGVEISPNLVDAARRNLKKLKIPNSEIFLADATEFTQLDDYTHVFMYNPFPAPVMERVLKNLAVSLQRNQRPLRLLYSNPLHEQTVWGSSIFKRSFRYAPYADYQIAVYEN